MEQQFSLINALKSFVFLDIERTKLNNTLKDRVTFTSQNCVLGFSPKSFQTDMFLS